MHCLQTQETISREYASTVISRRRSRSLKWIPVEITDHSIVHKRSFGNITFL